MNNKMKLVKEIAKLTAYAYVALGLVASVGMQASNTRTAFKEAFKK